MSSRRVVDAVEVVALLVQIAAGHPDYVHERAGYLDADGTGPGSIVGHVLHRLGASLDFLRDREGGGAVMAASQMPRVHLTVDAVCALWDAQQREDAGWMWSWVAAGALADFTATRPDG
jgi:hypothetical protein